MSELEVEFLLSVSKFLDAHPDIKNRYEEKNAVEFEQALEERLVEIEQIKEDEKQRDIEEAEELNKDLDELEEELEQSVPDKDPLLKSLYRKIVKKTHPDKVTDKKKNEFYSEATIAYDDNDIFTIYLICNKLDIEYIMRLEDTEKLHEQIGDINQNINMIESTFPWKWGETIDDTIKTELVKAFIIQRMG
jgi:hypothetical protein